MTVCKSTGNAVRQLLGTAADSPLSRIGVLLERPALIQRIEEDALEDFQSASERLQLAIAAADASAFLAQKDYSAQTTFRRGEVPSTPNLDDARQSVDVARRELKKIIQLIGG